ncbi:hypothetical protein PO909_023073, partial [Leuciscus waleckii]
CILVTLSRRLHSSSLINITSDTTSTFLINNLRPQNRRQTGLRFLQNCCSLRVLNRFHIRKAEQFLQGRFFCARRSDLCYNKEQRWSAGNTKKTLAEGSLRALTQRARINTHGTNMNRSSGEEADLALKNDPASSTTAFYLIYIVMFYFIKWKIIIIVTNLS